MRWILRSKIHQAHVTVADPSYVGSITIDEDLVERAGLLAGEKVLVASITSGQRLETYVMLGPRQSGQICINGAAARLIRADDQIIIMGFELTDCLLQPKVVLVDQSNRFLRFLEE